MKFSFSQKLILIHVVNTIKCLNFKLAFYVIHEFKYGYMKNN